MSQAATLSPHRSSRTETVPIPASVEATPPTSLMDFLLARTKVTRIPKRLIDEETTQEGHRFVCVLLYKARQDGIALVSYKEMGQLCGWSRSKVDRVVAQLKPLDLFEHGRFDVNGRKRWGFSINWARLGFTNGPSGSCRGGWTPIPNRLITSTLSDEVYRCMELLIHYRDMANGISHPSILRLTQRLRCCESSVFNYLRVLREESCFSRAEFEIGQETCLAFDINWDVVAPVERPTEKVKTVPVLRVKNTPVPGVEPLKSWSDNTPVPGVEPLKSWSDNTPVPGPNIDSKERDPKNTPPSTRTQQDATEGGERAGVGGLVFLSREEKAPEPVSSVASAPEAVARTLGGLPIVGRDSQEARDLAEWVGREVSAQAADVARQWCDKLPIEWIESTIVRRIWGNARIASPPGMLTHLLHTCLHRGECEFYAEATVAAGPAAQQTAGKKKWELPSDTKRREVKESFRVASLEANASKPPIDVSALSEDQLRVRELYARAGILDDHRFQILFDDEPDMAKGDIAKEVERRKEIDRQPFPRPESIDQHEAQAVFVAAGQSRLYPYYASCSVAVAEGVVRDIQQWDELDPHVQANAFTVQLWTKAQPVRKIPGELPSVTRRREVINSFGSRESLKARLKECGRFDRYPSNGAEPQEPTDPASSGASSETPETDENRQQRERDERRQAARKMFEDAGALDYYRWFENEDRPIETLRSLLAGELSRRGQSPPAVRG